VKEMKKLKIDSRNFIGGLLIWLIVLSTSCSQHASSYAPKQIPGINGVSAIAAGANHTIAIKTDGSLWAWGWNSDGQLGDGTRVDRTTPMKIAGIDGVIAIAAGYAHTLALKADGSLWAWGYNGQGQLGNGLSGETYGSRTPEQIIASGVTAIAAGNNHSVALKTDGSLWAWGNNAHGQLGDGTTEEWRTPKQIMASGVTAMAAGDMSTLTIKADGSLWAWGKTGYSEQTPNESGTIIVLDTSTPEQIIASGVTAVAAGAGHTLVIMTDGSLWAWGANGAGQLGDGKPFDSTTPQQIIASGVTAIAAGNNHSIALKTDGSLWVWGDNKDGQIGDGTTTDCTTPKQIIASGVTAIGSGNNFTLAIKSDGSVWAWGFNGQGQLGE
jgi:hypothetical protein